MTLPLRYSSDRANLSSPKIRELGGSIMHKHLTLLSAVAGIALGLVVTLVASAQPEDASDRSDIGYPSVAAALEAMRIKSGTKVSMQGGWTVIEEAATKTIWSFTPAGHLAHPAAVRRAIVQRGNDIFVEMKLRCESMKPACDKLVAEFQELNNRMRDALNRKRAP